jgi:hypothetical protein
VEVGARVGVGVGVEAEVEVEVEVEEVVVVAVEISVVGVSELVVVLASGFVEKKTWWSLFSTPLASDMFCGGASEE